MIEVRPRCDYSLVAGDIAGWLMRPFGGSGGRGVSVGGGRGAGGGFSLYPRKSHGTPRSHLESPTRAFMNSNRGSYHYWVGRRCRGWVGRWVCEWGAGGRMGST
jgi:hypothetical protein